MGKSMSKSNSINQYGITPPLTGGLEKLPLTLREPTDREFKQICLFITEFELDDRALEKHQFTIALRNGELVGFGRLREHLDCVELCSLGVVASHRRQGIGKAIVAKLLDSHGYRNSKNIYLVCIIPDFFEPFGFQSVKEYPISIQHKVEYCTSELVVPETYVAMLLKNAHRNR